MSIEVDILHNFFVLVDARKKRFSLSLSLHISFITVGIE